VVSLSVTAFVVEDSRLVRRLISDILGESGVGVVGSAGDGLEAMAAIRSLPSPPDVITLDLGMPGLDGLSFLECVSQAVPSRVVVVTGAGEDEGTLAMKAASLGAVEFVRKPAARALRSKDWAAELVGRVQSAALARPSPPRRDVEARVLEEWLRPFAPGSLRCLAVGASTGGPRAVERLLRRIPRSAPLATLVVQHMPAGLTRGFAERLNLACVVDVEEARDGTALRAGVVLVAPGDQHLTVEIEDGRPVARLSRGPRVHSVRPSVDVLFESVAGVFGRRAMGVVLSGMGRDGSAGLHLMRRAGALTAAQDEATSVLWGMPRAAMEEGGALMSMSPEELGLAVLQWVRKPPRPAVHAGGD
jgi:two-component system chemotaxis response regulator CheB